jgi:hypothetical protein
MDHKGSGVDIEAARERLQQIVNDYAKGRADAADLLEDMEVAQLELLEEA